MKTMLAILLVAHGLIHLLGTAKAFGWAALPQLTGPITPGMGALWLAAALLFVGSAVSLVAWPREWWMPALCAVVISMIAIAASWADAKAGAVANLIVIAAVITQWLAAPKQ